MKIYNINREMIQERWIKKQDEENIGGAVVY